MRLSTGRQAAIVGGAFLLIDLAAILLGGPLPAIDDSPAAIRAFYVTHDGRLLAQAYVRGASMATLLWFAVLLVGAIGTRAHVAYARLFVAAAAIVAAVELARVAVVAGLALQPDRVTADVLLPFHAAGLGLGATIAFPLAAGQIAAARMLATTSLPRWLTTSGLVLAATWLITAIRIATTAHSLWIAGTLATFLWGLWLAAVCIALWRAADDKETSR